MTLRESLIEYLIKRGVPEKEAAQIVVMYANDNRIERQRFEDDDESFPTWFWHTVRKEVREKAIAELEGSAKFEFAVTVLKKES